MSWAQAVLAAVFGACAGSYLSVVLYRLPQGADLGGSSACPSCGHRLGVRENIPIFGWLLLRGRCRHCARQISSRYLLLEATVAAAWALAVLAVPGPVAGVAEMAAWLVVAAVLWPWGSRVRLPASAALMAVLPAVGVAGFSASLVSLLHRDVAGWLIGAVCGVTGMALALVLSRRQGSTHPTLPSLPWRGEDMFELSDLPIFRDR